MSGGEAAPRSLARGAAAIALATAASRVTGFVRVVVVAAAMGTTFLANTYQTANTAPNVVFELVAAGVLTSIFVPTFVEYLVGGRRSQGWEAANALTSAALVGLIALMLALMLTAPALMHLLTIGVQDSALRELEIELGTAFLRLFSPQVVFYGAGMIMTSALHAHRKFGMAAVAPIFNNVVVIGVYVAYAMSRGDAAPTIEGISTGQTVLLGAGTTLGVVAMTLCLVPGLARLGWRYRFVLDFKHPAVRRGIRLGAWALGYAGGYQAGLIVVLVLANRIEGGVAAYQWAYTFFYLPHALFAVPIFQVLFTAMSEHVARGEEEGFAERLSDGLSMLAFILLPLAGLLLIASGPIARITLEYGVMTQDGAELVGRVLSLFAVGLPTYSAFLVMTRAFYAFGDTKTPALINGATVAASAVVGAVLFFAFSRSWAVPALALGHSVGFALGSAAMAYVLVRRVGSFGGPRLRRALMRSLVLGLAALAVMATVHVVLPDDSKVAALVNFVATITAGGAVYLGLMRAVGSSELARLRTLVGSRLQ